MAKLVKILLFFLTLLTDHIMISDCSQKRDSASKVVVCIEAEKQALVSIKRDLIDPWNELSSWDTEENCCKWDGIVCDNKTGRVLELNLFGASLSGKISPSLLNLKHLTRLDLSFNYFEGIPIPSFMGSLASLRFLDLANAGFMGLIPEQLGNLSNLHELKVSGSFLYSKSLHWISGLSSLEYLDMSNVNLSLPSDHWLLAINNLPSLLELDLSICELQSSVYLPSRFNLTSLRVLDLSVNNLDSLFLCGFLKNMSHLQSLDMAITRIGPTIPNCIYSLPNLQHLNLVSNGLQGVISSDIGNLSSIVDLDLSHNSLQGNIPMSMGNLCNLERLDSSNNKHNGNLSEAFEGLSFGCLSYRLYSLCLDNNDFSGHITHQIVEFKNLSILYLANNNISGPIPVTLGSLLNLERLDISSNLLEGVVSEAHFAKLSNLEGLRASGNSLTLEVSRDWVPPFQLVGLYLDSWNLGPQFPLWIKSQKRLRGVRLYNTGISNIPNWLCNLSESFTSLDLSRNKLRGRVPDFLDALMLDLSSNEFTGPLPRVSSRISWLDLSNNSLSGDIHGLLCSPKGNHTLPLSVLKLRDNLLAGEIPDCWSHWPSLTVIDLANNNLSGEIPISMGLLQVLRSLHLRNNSLTREIPNSFHNCSSLDVLDLGLNKLVGIVPRWMGILSSLRVLNLRSNKLNDHVPIEVCALVKLQVLDVYNNNLSGSIPQCFKNFKAMADTDHRSLFFYGSIDNQDAKESTTVATKGTEYQYENILHLMSSLDLSSNNFSGEIPEELVSLRALKSLNLSGNHLTGRIPSKIGNMSALESLDLSRNLLLGEIPGSMSDMNFLNFLNLSYNDLSGEIPKSIQLQSFNSSSFIGNELLCGDPLPKKCRETSTENNQEEEEDDDDDDDEFWFRLGIGMGFGVTFVGVIAPLVLFKFWRTAYFWFFQEYVWYNILDGITRLKYKIGVRTPTYLA